MVPAVFFFSLEQPIFAQDNSRLDLSKTLIFDSQYANANKTTSSGDKYLVWKEDEINTVRALISVIYRQFPSLVRRAMPGSTLCFRRIEGGWGPRASASDGIINLYDSFFSSDNQLNPLLHELVHAVDQDSRVSLSPVWISFAAPTIEAIRLNADFMNRQAVKQYEFHLLDSNVWPSMYGTKDLEEALAEYFVAFANNPHFCSHKTFVVNVLPNLLQPTETQQLFSEQLRQAIKSLEQEETSFDVKEKLLQAAQLDQTSPLPQLYLTKFYLKKGAFEQALQSATQTIQKMEKNNFPHSELTVQFIYRTRGFVEMKLGRYQEAIADYSTCLKSAPNRLDCYFQRAVCEERMGLYGDALQDFLYSKGYNPYQSNILSDSKCNPLFALRSSRLLASTSKTSDSYCLLALLQEFIADNSFGFNRSSLYQQAVLSYQTALSKEPNRIPVLVRLAEVEYKVGNLQKCREYCEQILRRSPNELPALVSLYRLSELKQGHSKLEPQFHLLRAKIQRSPKLTFYPKLNLDLFDWSDSPSSAKPTSLTRTIRKERILKLFEGESSALLYK